MMNIKFEVILDQCIDRINKGEKLDQCLADHPAYAAQLEPLLRSLVQIQGSFAFTPSQDAVRKGRLQLYAALDKRRKPSFWKTVFSRKVAWVTAVCVVIAMLAYAGLRYSVFDGDNGGNYVTQPTPEPTATNYAKAAVGGNFIFLVSDEVNAIADFDSIDVTIDKVSLLKSGDNASWIEFEPATKTFDLTLLPGDTTQELWQGDVPQGQYSKVVIYVSGVRGVLKASEKAIDIKLPSEKLQISIPFEVSAENVTSFVYDLTVVNTGNSQGGEKYLLKPQAGESGASQKPAHDQSTQQKTKTKPDIAYPSDVSNNRKN
jgi:hypothetical protein